MLELSQAAPLSVSPPRDLTRVEKCLVVFVMYLASTARIPLISSAYENEPGLFLSFLRMLGYLVTFGLIAAFYQSWIRGILKAKAIALLVALSVASVTWSISPATTLMQAVVLTGMTALGIYIGSRFNPNDLLYMVMATTAIIAGMSILAVALDPGFGGVESGGIWRGVFVHKNLLGQTMACGALASAIVSLSQPRLRRLAAGTFLACTFLTFLSNSMTSSTVLVLVLMSIPLLRLASAGSVRAVVVLVALVALAPVLFSNLDRMLGPLLSSIGRDTTLTGRTDVWAAAIEAIGQRPLLGYGHSAFWLNPSVAWKMEVDLYWAPPEAHNGYLDLFLAVGSIGFVIFIFSLIASVRHAFSYMRRSGGKMDSAYPAAFLLFFIIYNSTESITGVQSGFLWILYVAVSVNLAVTMYSDRYLWLKYENEADEWSLPAYRRDY